MSTTPPFRKQVIAVLGATGQVGTPLTKHLLTLGHDVKVFSRRSGDLKMTEFDDKGATVVMEPDMLNLDKMVKHLQGVETLICAVPGSKEVICEFEPIWLEAAVKAGVKRFVPTEFGAHSRGVELGSGVIFDYKKALHEKILASGIGWTFFYNGGIFDYFLPNLRFFQEITTFGDLDIPIYTHAINDIGKVAAMALTDDRTLNKCVQMDYNCLTQTEAVTLIKQNFPDYPFEYKYFSSECITSARDNASDEVTAKKGKETDKERWGINYTIYVEGKLASFTDETLRTTELYPAYECAAKPQDALRDKAFVFEQ